MPLCQAGTGLTHTGFPPTRRPSPEGTAAVSPAAGRAGRDGRREGGRGAPLSPLLATGDGPALVLLEPSTFRGARAASTAGRGDR